MPESRHAQQPGLGVGAGRNRDLGSENVDRAQPLDLHLHELPHPVDEFGRQRGVEADELRDVPRLEGAVEGRVLEVGRHREVAIAEVNHVLQVERVSERGRGRVVESVVAADRVVTQKVTLPAVADLLDGATRDDVGHPRFVFGVRGEDIAQGRVLGATPSGGGGRGELLGRELVDDRAERGIREKEEFLLVHAATVHPASDAPQSLVFVAGEEQTCTDT